MISQKLYRDFDIFSRALVGSRDVDPIYPVITSIIRKYKFEPEWFAFVYVAFYNLETAYKICRWMPTRADWNEGLFLELRKKYDKFGHERRGTARNPQNQIRMFQDIIAFLQVLDKRKNPLKNKDGMSYFDTNERFQVAVRNLNQHSVWASFKLAEIFEKSLGYEQFKIKDLGIRGKDPNSTDGTIAGLRLLFRLSNDYKIQDSEWYDIWDEFGVKLAAAYGFDIGEIETCFCKFNKLVQGNYYVGHDIEELFELKETLGKRDFEDVVESQFEYPIVELRKELKGLYKRTGFIKNMNWGHKFNKVNVGEIILSL